MIKLVEDICKVLSAKQAQNISVVDISKVSSVADYFVICSGRSVSQVKSLADYLDEEMAKQDVLPIRSEGVSEGKWVAMDYGNVIVHIFYKELRDLYALDTLWNNGSNVTKYED